MNDRKHSLKIWYSSSLTHTVGVKFFFSFFFQYSVSIEENALHSNLAQIRVIDLDEEYSANWIAVIFFISGNEGGWFDIEMNERTNVGILKVVKVWYNYPK